MKKKYKIIAMGNIPDELIHNSLIDSSPILWELLRDKYEVTKSINKLQPFSITIDYIDSENTFVCAETGKAFCVTHGWYYKITNICWESA